MKIKIRKMIKSKSRSKSMTPCAAAARRAAAASWYTKAAIEK